MNTFISSGGIVGRRIFGTHSSVIILLLFLSFHAFGQGISCFTIAAAPNIHAEGLTEPIGNLTTTCTGGTANSTASIALFITLNTNITNRLDMNGNPTGISITANSVPTGILQVESATTLFLNNITYTVPMVPSTPVNIVVSGILAAAALVPAGTGPPILNAAVVGEGATFENPPQIPVAFASPTLLTSMINNGIPCAGSPLPATTNFSSFVNESAVSSAVRITENYASAFTAKTAATDTGIRILVTFSGYSSGSRVFVPDAIVGNDGSVPTSAGEFFSGISPGIYTPGMQQLLLLRINGADATGFGGTFVFPQPVMVTDFSSVSEISLTNGAGYAVYEVVDDNPNAKESAQIPLFLVAPQTACTGSIVIPALGAQVAPVSTVSIATATDPIPRFVASTPGSDCTQNGDCNASYFPNLSVETTPISLSAASLGNIQGATFVANNSGGGVLGFAVTVTYQSGAGGWLTVTPSSADNYANVQVVANPGALQPGTYTATINVTAGAGCVPASMIVCTAAVPVTFTVGPVGVTILNVGNAASFQYGTVAPGSYAVLFGLNFAGTSAPVVTFNQAVASVVYSSATQINVIVPPVLGTQTAADVIVTVAGQTSNYFKVALALNAPGIFGDGIVNYDDGAVNSAANPITRGHFAIVYLTGLTIPVTGLVTVNIGGQTNLIPSFAGAQGTFAGLDQVNITVPATLPATPNPVPLTVCIPGPAGTPVCSNAVNLYIQ